MHLDASSVSRRAGGGRRRRGSSLTRFDVVVSVRPVENRQLHQLHLLQIVFALRLREDNGENVSAKSEGGSQQRAKGQTGVTGVVPGGSHYPGIGIFFALFFLFFFFKQSKRKIFLATIPKSEDSKRTEGKAVLM